MQIILFISFWASLVSAYFCMVFVVGFFSSGMILELDSKQLKSFVQDSPKLREVLRMAYATLQQTS